MKTLLLTPLFEQQETFCLIRQEPGPNDPLVTKRDTLLPDSDIRMSLSQDRLIRITNELVIRERDQWQQQTPLPNPTLWSKDKTGVTEKTSALTPQKKD